MSGDHKPGINKMYLAISSLFVAVGAVTCVRGVLALGSGQIIAGNSRTASMTGGEAIVCGALVMGLGGWALRRVLQRKLR